MDDYVPGALSALLSRQPLPTSAKKASKKKASTDENDAPIKKKSKREATQDDSTNKPKKKSPKIIETSQEFENPPSDLFSKYQTKIPEVPVGKNTLEIKEKPAKGKKKGKPTDREEQRLNRKTKRPPITEELESRTVFIGNAPPNATRKQIKKLFVEYGAVETVWQRSLLHKTEKLTLKMMGTDKKLIENLKSTTFYVRFKTKDEAQKALKLHGHVLDQHHLQVRPVNKKILESFKTVFVGNVPFKTTEDELIDYFTEKCGAVESIRLIRDKNTGLGKGIAYVAFEDPSCVASALKLDGEEFEDRKLRISKVMKKKKMKQMPVASAKGVKTSKRNLKAKIKREESDKIQKKISKFVDVKKKGPKADGGKKIPSGVVKAIKKRQAKKSKKTKKSFMS